MCVGSKRKFQPSSCFSFEVKLKSLDVDLLQHCSIHFVQHSETAATTRPDSWYGAPTFTLPNKPLVIAARIFVSSDRRTSCGQLQVSVKLEGVIFGAKTKFFPARVHGDVELASLWTVMLVLQQFTVHGRALVVPLLLTS